MKPIESLLTFVLPVVFVSIGQAQATSDATLPSADELIVQETHDARNDLRMHQLTAMRPEVTALRLDQRGVEVARLDIYMGGRFNADEAPLRAFLNDFTFGDEAPITRDDAEWRTSLFRGVPAAIGAPTAIFFDPQADLAIAVHLIAGASLWCTGSNALSYNANLATGSVRYWYHTADMITACTGPQRNSNADPNIQLAYSNGSSYQFLVGSYSPYTIDMAIGVNGGCYSNLWRTRVHAQVGGALSVRIVLFNAN